MSLASVRPFFRDRLNSLGYREHSDAFDDFNRPQANLDKLYRIETTSIVGAGANSAVHEFEVSVNLHISLHGVGSKNVELADRAMGVADEVLAEILANRRGPIIKDIVPGTALITPLSDSDDNDLILNMEFTCTIYCEFI